MNIAGSLRSHAKNRGINTLDFQARYVMECLLVRLDAVDEAEEMMLVGSMLWHLQPDLSAHGRPTRDIDLRLRNVLEREQVADLFHRAVAAAPREDWCRFEIRLDHEGREKVTRLAHAGEHEGVRIELRGYLQADGEEAYVDFHVDVAFGQRRPSWAVRTPFRSLHPKVEGGAFLMCPLEYQAAEKLSAIHSLGLENTRLKDFNDLWLLATGAARTDPARLAEAVRMVFDDRGQGIPDDVMAIPGLSLEYAEARQREWESWLLNSRRKGAMPADFAEVVFAVRSWAHGLFEAASQRDHTVTVTA